MQKTKILYDGLLEVKDIIKISVNLGNIFISSGTPHLLVTTDVPAGQINLNSTTSMQMITGDHCSVELTYPANTTFNVEMDTGNIKLDKLALKNLAILLKKGNIRLDLQALESEKINLDLQQGTITGDIRYSSIKNSEFEINLDDGVTDLKIVLPKGLGFNTTFKEPFLGILDIPKDIENKIKVILKLKMRKGVLKIKNSIE